MKHEISVPVELLIAFLAEHNVAIYLSIALLVVHTFCNEMHTTFFQQILSVKSVLKEIVKSPFQCNRNRILKVCLMFETNAINAFTALRYSIVTTIQYLIIYIIITIFLKSLFDGSPGITLIMIQHAFDVLKNKHFGLAFYDYTREFTKQSSPRILKSTTLAPHGECLTRCTTDEQIHLPPIRSCIKLVNIRVPSTFIYIIVSKV